VAKPTIAAGFPRAFLEFAVSRGARRETLLERAQIRIAELEDQDNRIPLPRYLALVRAGIELCNDPALSLRFGESTQLPDLSIVGLMGQSFQNFEEGQRQLNRYSRLGLDADDGGALNPVEVVRENGDIWLRFTNALYVDHPLLTESALARGVSRSRARHACAPELAHIQFPKAVRFTHNEPSYRAEYDRIFGVPLFFDSPMNAFLIDEAFLNFKRPRTSPYLSGILTARADALLEDLDSSRSTTSRVESLLLPVLHTREANMSAIAAELALSRQTLFRKLKAEGVTFKQVLDDLRHKMALHYLNGKRASVNETAYLVGFSEPAAFSRAFKRWTGSSPLAARRSPRAPS
jgi:AraC-like DNA-binding protein